jgi:proteic killer suppression protein
MIESFRHKGLRSLFEQDDVRKVKADQVDRLRLILSALDQASDVQDMSQPTFRLHPLKGNRKGFWEGRCYADEESRSLRRARQGEP